jgi:hypothetical protein
MVVDAVRTYFDATSGLTELSRKEAVAAAKALLKAEGRPTAPAAADQEALPARVGQSIQALAGELIETNEANRTAIADLVRSEVAHQLERMEIVPRAEYERVVRRVAELERRLAARYMVERVPVAEVPVVAAAAGAVVGGASAPGPESAPPAAAAVTVPAPVEDAEDPEPGAAAREPAGEDEAATGAEDAADAPEERDGSEDGTESATGPADGEGAAGARATASRGKPRTAAKTTRARSAPKRTAKAKGSTGKGPTKK